MKKSTLIFLFFNVLFFNSFLKNEALGQSSVSVTITYTGAQALGCCNVCGLDYWCLNNTGGCGQSNPCATSTFPDPVPAGNIVTGISMQYYSAQCSGGSLSATLNGTAFPVVNEGNTGCLCSTNPCGSSAPPSTGTFPCGWSGYTSGNQTFQLCTGMDVCMQHVVITYSYAPANQATPAATPSNPSGSSPVCAGTSYNYSATSSNATTYTWTVPAGWTINSGQGTGTINATPGGAGNICVTAGNLCGNSAQSCTPVSVISTPAAPAAPTGSSGCSGSTQIYTTTGSAGATSYNWTVPVGSVINSGQGTTSIDVTLGSTSGNVCVTASNSCGTSGSSCLPVTIGGVQATPGAPAGTTSICNGSTQTYSTSGSAGATSYNWTVPAGAVINSGQGTTSISVTMGASAGNVCVSATGPCGTSAAACTALTITTTPLAPTGIIGTSPVCPGNENYSINSVAGATGYTWVLAGAGGSITGGQGTTAISTNWSSAVTGTVSVTADNGCGSSSPATFTVLVNPLPNVSITPTPTSVCAGGTATLVANGAVNYSWLGGTLPASGGTVTVTPPSASQYTVTGTDGNNCVNTAVVSVGIDPTPTVSITGSPTQNVCSGGSVTGISFTSNPAGTITWTNSNTSLGGPDLSSASGSGNIAGYTAPNVSSVTTGVITANAVASGSGCPSTGTSASYTLTINPLPVASASVVTSAPCGQPTGCINSVTGSGGASPYQYSYDGGTSWSASSTTCSIAAGTYTVEIKDNNSCIGNANITVPSTSGPSAPTVSAGSANVCVGGSATFSVTAPVGSYTYTWSDQGGGSGTGTTYTVNNVNPPGSYTVSVIATDPSSCLSSPATTTITVDPAPTAPALGGSATNPLVECQGAAGQSITVATTGTVTSVPVWYNGATYVTSGLSYTPGTSVTGTTVYTIIDSATVTGCKNASAGNVLTVTVTVNPSPGPPVISGSATNPLVECQGSAPQAVTVATTGTVTSVPVWYNGSTYVTTGTSYSPGTAIAGTTVYTIADSATAGGCTSASAGNVLTVTVTINPLPTGPTLGGSATNPLSECQNSTPQSVTVATTGTVSSVPVWYNGATYVTSGTSYAPGTSVAGTTVYTITDSATVGGCKNLSAGNVLTVTVTILPTPTGPVISGSSTNPLIECEGTAPQSVTVATTGTVTSVPVWYNGATYVTSGTSYAPGTSTPGTTIYTVIDSSTVGGCKNMSAGNVLTVTVTINPNPAAPVVGGTSTNPLVECQNDGLSVSATPTGTVTSVPVWYNGPTHVATGNTYTPPSSTVGTTVYTVVDSATATGCKNLTAGNVLTVTVTVNASPTANSAGAPDSANCGLPTGGVHGVSVSGGTGPYHYQWYFGPIALAGDTFPTLTGVGIGTYSVLITDANNCPAVGGVTTFTVLSGVPVIASFMPSTQLGNAPLAVSFSNTSTGANSYNWDFGSGTTPSTVQNPSYTYTTPGTYTVLLTASNGLCSGQDTAVIVVDVPTTIIIPNVFSPNGDSLNDEFFIACTGMKTLVCDIYNRWGQKVYTLTGPNQSWDGRLNTGHPATEGTYYYMLIAEGFDKKTYKSEGSLTLVK